MSGYVCHIEYLNLQFYSYCVTVKSVGLLKIYYLYRNKLVLDRIGPCSCNKGA